MPTVYQQIGAPKKKPGNEQLSIRWEFFRVVGSIAEGME
jgi:hypothetical protein